MDPDLYLVYRIADRIITANSIKRPVRVAVRRAVDCQATLGYSNNSVECQKIGLLPDVDQATNFDIWAAQVIGTMIGNPNAAASSQAGTIYVNIPLLKQIIGKPNQLACVIGHELAHVTQNHGEEANRKAKEYDSTAAFKIRKAVNNAHNAQNSARTFALVMSGIASGISGNNSSLYQTQYSIAMDRLSAQMISPQIIQWAMKYSPEVSESIGLMQGLSERYVKRTQKDINNYLRDSALSKAGHSRSQEYEADLLGVEYIAAAGFSPNECEKYWSETTPHEQDKLIERLLPPGLKDQRIVKGLMTLQEVESIRLQEEAQKASQQKRCPTGVDGIGCKAEKRKAKKPQSERVPSEVLEILMRTHPGDAERSETIKNHIAQKALMSRIKAKGSAVLASIFMRNWSYDDQSESVVIHGEMMRPEKTGLKETGTTGIDIDKILGF